MATRVRGLDFPSKRKVLHQMISVISITYPLTALPQLFEIYVHKNVQGVSIVTWALFMLFSIPLLFYARDIQDKKLTTMYSIWLFIYVAIIGGVLLYQ